MGEWKMSDVKLYDLLKQACGPDCDQWDMGGKFLDAVTQSMADDGDAAKELARLVSVYDAADANIRGIMNFVMITVCGYSIPTLVKIALGKEPEGDENPEWLHPSMVQSVSLFEDAEACLKRLRRPDAEARSENGIPR
jgi:hypothetical protein